MKILALGGCGQEGKPAAERFANLEQVSEVIIGDINIDNAQALAAELGDGKVRAFGIDVTDHAALVELMRRADVVVNFVGPYFKFGKMTLQAAIEAGIHYVDINDDHDATLEALELDEAAREAGISAVIGMGASPGLMNVLARLGAEQLDKVDEIHLRWAVSVTDVEDIGASAAMIHGLHIVDGLIPQFLDGKTVKVEPFAGTETFDFPGLGKQEVFYLGHSEPVTLPRYIEGVKTVTNKGSIPGFNEIWKAIAGLGLASSEPLALKDTSVNPQEVALELLGAMPESDPSTLPPPISDLVAIVRGVRGDEEVECEYAVLEPQKMNLLTGLPAYVATLMVGQGQITQRGVFAPEGGVDPQVMLAELAKLGVVIKERKQTKRLLSF